MRQALLVLLFALVGVLSQAHATAQMPDVILIDGKQYALNTNPLDRYLETLGDKAPRFDAPHTALWRGYVATWELVQGKLYLRKVKGYRQQGRPEVEDEEELAVDGMQELFPGRQDVVADWYTGTLIVPDGEQAEYVHMGYATTYERYIVATVKEGIQTDRRNLSLAEFERFRDERFERYRRTDEFKKQVADNRRKKDAMSDAQFERFLKEYWAERYLSAP
ncbi:hypothetical protein [Luteimonas aquatica]|uniref:hypothetical protein n=1 Tax=Luteimonas aquatica TaxID=450364 RepID=UPI001F597A04|nr:hypothetical protein [Luteimonas aquatica]